HTFEPHDRGAILVAAVFKAFLRIYRARSADLYRIATQGTGTLPEGDIHPDLTARLAAEAAWAADRVLQMCIRAIDYCPPVDITYGDFLRGLITADLDYAPDDKSGFRVVFIESFREWGIYPAGVRSLGIDALAWPSGDELMDDETEGIGRRARELTPRMKRFVTEAGQSWTLDRDRYAVWKELRSLRIALWKWLHDGDAYSRDYARLFGLVTVDAEAPPTVYRSGNEPAVEVHSVRPALRRTLDGGIRTDLVMEMTQRRRGYFDPEEQKARDDPANPMSKEAAAPDFIFRAGCTALIDPTTGTVRRVIRTRGAISDDSALERMRRFLTGDSDVPGEPAMAGVVGDAYTAGIARSLRAPARVTEPFAMLHRAGREAI
ncbi:MAG TPA: hypothetical protein VFP05_06615, partial [Thermomicrobiales bacterium]|nr:hypothetical protein [Thermomicrobiales bacterium]